MPLVGLKGGGLVGQESTAISTSQVHPLGAVAVDSSGGEYLYTRGTTAAGTVTAGYWVYFNSTVGDWQPHVPSTTSGSTGVIAGSQLGVMMSSNGSTATFGWVQVYGRSTVALGISTTAGSNKHVGLSTVTVGYVATVATSPRIFGAQIMTSNASSNWVVFLSHPVTSSIIGT